MRWPWCYETRAYRQMFAPFLKTGSRTGGLIRPWALALVESSGCCGLGVWALGLSLPLRNFMNEGLISQIR